MLEGIYRTMQNAHAVRSVSVPIDVPKKNLGIYEDEVLHSVPLIIYSKQSLRAYTPVVMTGAQVPYEKVAQNGKNDCISLDDFSTDTFDIGTVYGGI